MADETKKESKEIKSMKGTGLEPNVAGLLIYLADIVFIGVFGLVFFLIEKNNKFVRFAGAQSMSLGLAFVTMLWLVIPVMEFTMPFFWGLTMLLRFAIWIGIIALRIMLAIKANDNVEWELPVIGKIARGFIK